MTMYNFYDVINYVRKLKNGIHLLNVKQNISLQSIFNILFERIYNIIEVSILKNRNT